MNKDRRERLRRIVEDLESIRDEEQEALDNLPEAIGYGERGEAMLEAVDAIDEARDTLDNVCIS